VATASKKGESIIVSYLLPPGLIVIAVLCLWENEGRFDFSKAAKESVAVSRSEFNRPNSDAAISYTGRNFASPIFEEYVGKFEGYHKILRSTEIYSWNKTTSKNRDKWTLGWYSSIDNNSRNRGLVKKLTNATLYPEQYKIDSLPIAPQQIHFVDTTIPLDLQKFTLTAQAKNLGLSSGDGQYLYRRLSNDDQLGDERVHYDGIPVEETATYFGKLENSRGVAKQFKIKKSLVSEFILNDAILHHLVNGPRLVALEKIRSYFKMLKWLIRGLGMLALFFGFCFCLEKFLHVLIDLPVLGSIVSFGVWGASLVLAFLVGGSTMVLSMIYNNPQITIPIIAGVVLMTFALFRSQKKTKAGAREFLESSGFEGKRGELSFLTLVKLALMEDGLSAKENRFLVAWGKKQGLSEETMTQLFHQGRENMSPLPLQLTTDDLYLLTSLAMIDGHLSSKELKHLNSAARQLKLGPEDVKNIIHQVKNGQRTASVIKNAA